MAEFKPMVKMMTTEPTVELKLKKGGSAHKKMSTKGEHGHKPMAHKMDGGIMGALSGATPVIAGQTAAPVARVPARPSLAARRKAMAARPALTRPMMKKGGKACATGGSIPSETTSGTPKTTMVHQAKVDKSSAKTGDVKVGNAGGYKKGGKAKKYATGGVALGNAGGFKKGGKAMKYATGGSIPSETTEGNYDVTEVHQAKKDTSKAKTGDVKLGNAGGFKKGGSSKKAFASGGSVQDEGKATSMPQGNKRPSAPVSINRLSGTFKKGGNVSSKKLQGDFDSENAIAVKESKAKLLDQYSPYQKAKGGSLKKFASGGATSDSDMAYTAVKQAEKAGKKTMVDPSSDEAFNAAVGTLKNKMRSQTKYPSGLTDSDIDKVLSSKKFQEGASHFSDYKRGGKAKK
jgi:hypothetical protein